MQAMSFTPDLENSQQGMKRAPPGCRVTQDEGDNKKYQCASLFYSWATGITMHRWQDSWQGEAIVAEHQEVYSAQEVVTITSLGT